MAQGCVRGHGDEMRGHKLKLFSQLPGCDHGKAFLSFYILHKELLALKLKGDGYYALLDANLAWAKMRSPQSKFESLQVVPSLVGQFQGRCVRWDLSSCSILGMNAALIGVIWISVFPVDVSLCWIPMGIQCGSSKPPGNSGALCVREEDGSVAAPGTPRMFLRVGNVYTMLIACNYYGRTIN